jgi:hypothetical protein
MMVRTIYGLDKRKSKEEHNEAHIEVRGKTLCARRLSGY